MAIQNFLYDQIDAIFDDCSCIKIYRDGNVRIIEKGTKEFDEIIKQWQIDCNNGYEMPAYFVALPEESVEDLKTGLHIEFLFDGTRMHNDMPFDALVLKMVPNQYGYTLTRHHDGIYEGRCYHLHRFEPTNELLDIVNRISETK